MKHHDQFPTPVRHCPGLCVLLLALVHSTSFAAEKWLDEFNVVDIASGYSDSRPNKSISDKPLSVGGVVFKRGVGTHAPSSGSFKTDGKSPLRFTAKVGADDAADGVGSMVFQVFGDDKKLFDSGLMRKGDPAKDVDVDLKGHKQIELRVTDGGNGNTFDHANWCDARFVYDDSPPQLALRWTLELPHFSGEAPAAPSKSTAVTSPNGKVAAHVGVSGGRLVLAVRRDGKTVLDPSPLGVMVDGVDLGDNVEIGTPETYTTNTTYPDPRGPGSLKDQCKGVKLSLRTKGSNSSWTLDVRAYDDGVAWRYLVPGSGTRKVTGEATSFVLPERAAYWTNHNTINYEGNFLSFTAKGSAASKPVTMPITAELPDGGFACLTEANIIGYSGMTIGPRGRILTGIFEDDTKGWNLAGNITTPWRIVIAVDSLDALVNQSIVYNVSPPPDPKLFPKGKDADWIKPGCAYWTWNIGGRDSANWDRIQGFVDDAASLNCPYYVIDDGWRDEQCGWHRNGKNEWASLKEFCAYAAKKNVKLMVWQHSGGIRDLAAREEFFRNVSEAGAVGVKIDFMDNESQQLLEFYRSCLEIAARNKVMVNFHGAYKPAGEERTWPNWMTREAILGMENGGGIRRQTFAALPFTRLVTGPADFTPADFRPGPMGNSTAGSQLAITVAYASPLLHWSDSLKAYKAQGPEVLDFIRNKPAVWDETRVLPGSKIGKAALMARRSGDAWYVAAINGTDQDMTHEIKTSFLAAGKWDAVSFSDVPGDKTKLSVNKSSVTSASAVNARMSPGGGFVMVIRPAR